jgi:hypothetical protein
MRSFLAIGFPLIAIILQLSSLDRQVVREIASEIIFNILVAKAVPSVIGFPVVVGYLPP